MRVGGSIGYGSREVFGRMVPARGLVWPAIYSSSLAGSCLTRTGAQWVEILPASTH